MNNFNNELLHKRGVLSMARSQSPNSAGSQFSIMVDDAPHLNAQYASFGQVIEGMEAVDKIVAAQRDYNDRPLENQIMEKVTVGNIRRRLSGTGKSKKPILMKAM
ncbi:MAG: peptidylprolyl isomerase [Eubacteriales bacterium]